MSVKTSSGGCAVQVRHVSSYAVVLGFVSNPNDDFATTQIFSQRETGTFTVSNYLTIRVSQNESVVAIPPSRIDIATIDVTSFPQPNDLRNLTLVTRDLSTCAYQYVSSPVELPKVALTKITVVALSDDTVPITLLQRIFYFYQHFPVGEELERRLDIQNLNRLYAQKSKNKAFLRLRSSSKQPLLKIMVLRWQTIQVSE
ncbi:unnamed protein product [Caenorhabditis auriculariae]|uniref:Uncharacterized protein n=1 Tax=Caenorhabditis auriculariae TaxID=2777116 RepID=A0A8S1HWA5_9PELO|nr:unnamed protein product [Caenorhabditis auriculariae]